MSLFDDNALTIGKTPLVRLRKVAGRKATVLAKVESRNPAGSVKCRIGANMIWDAEKRGVLKPGMEIVEPTSGNTGIALAFVCAARKYKLLLTMPESMSVERRAMLKALGAQLVLTPADKGMKGAIEKAQEILAETPNGWMPQQFDNPANPAIHEATTGPEIWEACEGRIDAIVTGVGTGGTITGVTRFIRKKNPSFQAYAVEPETSPVISGGKPGPHKIQGIGAGFIPKNLDTSLLNGVVTVSNDEAMEWGRILAQEGIFAGISTGANACAVRKAIEQFKLQGKRIVTIACSFGERYLSTPLYKNLVE
ncbi:MAG: Cysteine synthase A [Verrucomicrobia bacterium ADurb.Bin345]|nr:MAG: Cysteine synthase A [Verrucomicrobia bacterium ADurb.Bin345]